MSKNIRDTKVMKDSETITLVTPCFNEAETIPYFYEEFVLLTKKMKTVKFELIFVDDGSKDKTLEIIKNIAKDDDRVKYLSFSRNFGKESAMLAGLEYASGNYVAIADVDLQDPILLIEKMYYLICNEGWDCIATCRVSRKGEPPIRSFFAKSFYKLINKISNTPIVDGARDFRLMKRNMVDAIISLDEKNRFSKGLFSWVGFKTKYLEYENIERKHGETKWSFRKLFFYSIDGIISFSTVPLVYISLIGIFFCIVAFLMIAFFIYQKIFFGNGVQGYAAMISIILFLGGIQLLGMGVLGQYIAKMFIEVKKRPNYIIQEKK